MILSCSADNIKSSKIGKSFTKREINTGNFKKILDLRKPTLAYWNVVADRFYNLSSKDKLSVAEVLSQDNMLSQWVGEDWQEDLGLASIDSMTIVLAEIQLGIKFGEDAYKTKVDIGTVFERSQQYQNVISSFNKDSQVPYGGALKKCLANNKSLDEICKLAIKDPNSANIMDKVFRAYSRMYLEQDCPDGYISDDELIDEIKIPTTNLEPVVIF